MKDDLVCECGHLKSHHETLATYTGDKEDEDEIWCGTNEDLTCECHTFIPDNLRYLERLDATNPGL